MHSGECGIDFEDGLAAVDQDGDAEPGKVLHGAIGGYVFPPPAHKESQFRFVVTIPGIGGNNDGFAIADYGTKFMIVAGLLNFIAVADAHHIAIGKKQ